MKKVVAGCPLLGYNLRMKENITTTSQTFNINDKAAFKAEWDKAIQAGKELKKLLKKEK
jgi:uncharacterized glyoxalase superfamily protein PhnB